MLGSRDAGVHRLLKFDRKVLPWIHDALSLPRARLLLDLTPEIAVAATVLSWPHRDPADRLIVATAIADRAPIVTKDDRIERSSQVDRI